MGKRIWLLLTICMVTVSMAFAQQKVTGTVIESETGEPVVGASVRVKNANAGAATDINGKFTLEVPANSKFLVVSYIGMKTKEVAVKPIVKVYLDSDARVIKEQIVVAYGTATKESFTGSAKVIGADAIAETQKTNALDALNGKVAGVQMYNASGQPGNTTPTIRIRGISSIQAGNTPLVIVDGAPFDGDINTINPADVESETILKDAAANALYGARGANGVILITTKKGKVGESAKITVDAKWGANTRSTQRYKTINNPAQYYETYYTALKNYASANGLNDNAAHIWANNNLIGGGNGLAYNIYNVPVGQMLIGTNGKLNSNATMGNVVNGNYLTADDWLDEAIKVGLRQEYTVTATQATDKVNFYSSFGYLKNEGITANSDYERFNGRLKADAQLKPWLKVGANISYSHYNSNSLSEDGSSNSSGNIWAVATSVAPIYPLYVRDADGKIKIDDNGYTVYDYGDGTNAGLSRPVFSQANPIGSNLLDNSSYSGNALNVNGFAEFRIYKDLKFTSNNTFSIDESRSTNLTNAFYGAYASSDGIISKAHVRSMTYNLLQQLDWNHNFDGHNVSVMVGHENYKNDYYSFSGNRSNMLSPANLELAGAVNDGSLSSYTNEYQTEGWLSRLQYDYNEKYFFSASIRRDASTNFLNKRWGSFWSAGAAWLINKEEFFNVDWVDMLKLKASYGSQGNDRIGYNRYQNVYVISNYDGNISTTPTSTMGNNDIQWESQGNFNTGVEFDLFGGRLSGNIEFFYRKTSDMLFTVPLAPHNGFKSFYSNIGDMRNRGVEIEFSGDIIRTKDLTWSADINLTHYRNKITYLPESRKTTTTFEGVKGYQSGNYFVGEGVSLYTFYQHQYAGVYQESNYVGDNADVESALGQKSYGAKYDPSLAGKPMWYTTKEVTVMDDKGQPVKDADGNKVTQTVKVKTTKYSEAKYYLSGSALPDLYGGFGTSLKWKNFDFSMNFAFQIGGQVYDSDYQSMMANPYSTSRGNAWHADILKAWTPENTSSLVPALVYNEQYSSASSDLWLTSASYLSLNNVNIGYTLPRSITRKALIEKLRVYVAADNVFVISARQGLDPRQSISGSGTNTYYPPVRAISGGITVTF